MAARIVHNASDCARNEYFIMTMMAALIVHIAIVVGSTMNNDVITELHRPTSQVPAPVTWVLPIVRN